LPRARLPPAPTKRGKLTDVPPASPRRGRADPRRTQVNTDSLVRDAILDLAEETQGRNIQWQIGSLPAVIGDRALLKQVWINLLANAVKYTRQRDPAVIQIRCVERAGEGEVQVQDNGAGFDMGFGGKLFGVFQPLHHAEEFEGTGIGLANVRRTIERHGGRTWAEGSVDVGATFYFTLPTDAEAAGPAPEGRGSDSAPPDHLAE